MAGIVTPAFFLAVTLPTQTATTPPTDAEIRQAVEQLGSPVFSRRQEASALLWRAGQEAEPALERALSNGDPEVALRARTILEQFRYGIYPDTPPEIVRIIENFRGGDLIIKRAALKQLRDRGEIQTLLALLKLEDSDQLRTQLTREFAGDASTITADLLVEGKIDDAEAWLELSAGISDQAKRNLAALHLLSGRMEEHLETLRKQVRDEASETAWRQLFYHLRAAGKTDEALQLLKDVGANADSLREGLLFELRDWPRLAAIYDEAVKDTEGLNIEHLGYAAAFHRLSGDDRAFQNDVKSIVQLAGNESQRWYCFEALLINGEFQQGIELLGEKREEAAFRLLTAQLRYREAFKLIGLPPVGEDPRPWFERAARDIQSDDEQLRARFPLALAAARALYRVGDREHALAAFAMLGKSLAGDDNGERLETLCEAERKLRLVEQAFEHGALALAKGPEGSALSALFPEQTDEANVWWRFFRQRRAGESHRASLDRVASMLGTGPKDAGHDEESRTLIEQAARQAAAMETDRRVQWHRALAETALRRGDRARAVELLENVAEVSAEAAMRLGDLHVEDQQWLQAARCYERASKDGESQALATYLRGHCLEKAGDKTQGAELTELAQLLPLADSSKRRDFAEGLKDRGMPDEAQRQWELILRTTGVRDWYFSNAAMNLGNLLSGKDYLAAADYWESLSLSVLKSSSSFVKVEGYLQLPHLVHKSRALGLLAEGKNNLAVKNLWISQAAFPGNIDLAEDLIPELEAAGLQSTADELFDKVYVLNERLCTDYPDNASTHNNLAWLAARNGRRLEEALHHARRAVELAPDTGAYLDTLAEALYRTGGRDEAIKLERRCLEQEPDNEHYQKQLARFEKG
jgi:tetratricopeptide (TPR) repeat protein